MNITFLFILFYFILIYKELKSRDCENIVIRRCYNILNNTFISSCDWSQSLILLFYFDL